MPSNSRITGFHSWLAKTPVQAISGSSSAWQSSAESSGSKVSVGSAVGWAVGVGRCVDGGESEVCDGEEAIVGVSVGLDIELGAGVGLVAISGGPVAVCTERVAVCAIDWHPAKKAGNITNPKNRSTKFTILQASATFSTMSKKSTLA